MIMIAMIMVPFRSKNARSTRAQSGEFPLQELSKDKQLFFLQNVMTNKTIKDGDIAPDSSGTICLHGQMERYEQIDKKRTIK